MDFMVFQYPMISVQACLDGILLGILFALIAYGMALQWGVMNIINDLNSGTEGMAFLFTSTVGKSKQPLDEILARARIRIKTQCTR